MKVINSLTAQNTRIELLKVHKPRSLDFYYASIFVFGTFGGGTVSIQASPDNGTTFITLNNEAGTAATFTANGMMNLKTGVNDKLEGDLILYASIATATNPSLTVTVFDNR